MSGEEEKEEKIKEKDERIDDNDGMVTWYYWDSNHNKLESKKPERCHIKMI